MYDAFDQTRQTALFVRSETKQYVRFLFLKMVYIYVFCNGSNQIIL